MQIADAYDNNTSLTPAQIQAEAPYEDAVWASFQPSYWQNAHPGITLSRYTVPNEDTYLISGHNLSWWQANHPDWILYACDANGNPTHDVPWYDTHFGDVPLDIHNPAVVDYQIHLLANNMIANGYNTLAVDNLTFVNYGSAPNPDLGEGNPQPGWYGCGYYDTSGTFHQIYHGGLDAADPTWIADIMNWISTARSDFQNDPTLAPHHLMILANSGDSRVLPYVDGVVYEPGFTHYDTYAVSGAASLFTQTLSWMQQVQQDGKAIFVVDYFCNDGKFAGTSTPCANSLSPAEADWALSTYAIGNDGLAAFYASPQGGAYPSYRSEYATSTGDPCGAYTQSSGVYERKFANALVLVNPTNGAQASVSLPAGHTYSDIEGRTVTNPLAITGPDGYVLLTSNGCS